MDNKELISPVMERAASRKATDRARATMWSLNIAIFMFAVLIVIIILLFQGIGVNIVALVSIIGLAMVWLVGRINGRRHYNRFYVEELEEELKKVIVKTGKESADTLVQEAMRSRLRS